VEALKTKYSSLAHQPVIGIISRYINWKGLQYAIPAFKRLLADYPNAKLLLGNAKGSYADAVKQLLAELPQESYTEIPFEDDIFALYHLFDIFVHTPIDPEVEAFGQTYVEALAAGIPSVFTLSGISREFIVDKSNALVVDFKNTDQIYFALKIALEDNELCQNIVYQGKRDVQQFRLENMMVALESIYSE